MENNQNEKLTKKEIKKMRSQAILSNPLYIIVMLLFFWPGGLYFMWKYKVFNLPVRIIISIIIPILVTIRILGVIYS